MTARIRPSRTRLLAPLLAAAALLAGCDQLGIESASVTAAKREAEGKAVGSACRHAGRAIEDCYSMNRKTDKASVFAGWREMDEYMRENKLEVVAPTVAAASASGSNKEAADGDAEDADESAPKKVAKAGKH